jgi:hypothetical protein
LASDGAVTGTPTALGSSDFTVAVTDGVQTATRALSITVDPLVLQPGELCSENPASAIATFEDATLWAIVRDSLGVEPSDDLTCAQLSTFTNPLSDFDGDPVAPITSLVGLQNLTGLTSIDLRFHSIQDISILSELPGMVSLVVGYNQINDISVLSELTNLDYLGLAGNPIPSDLQPLIDNTGLGTGDQVFLDNIVVDCAQVAILQGRGVTVTSSCGQ